MILWQTLDNLEPSAHLPPTAFIAFLQNHDQVGNRAVSAEGVGKPLYSTHRPSGDPLPAWSVSWLLVPSDRTSP
jgi:hypothetical protein